MGSLPSSWGTPERLLAEKSGELVRPKFQTASMRRGVEMEPVAREAYERLTGMPVEKACGTNNRFEFIKASLDGRNEAFRKSLEIKCPGKEDHALALAGKIPPKYIWQLVQILVVTGDSVVDYFSFDGENGKVISFERDRKLEMRLVVELTQFWEKVLKRRKEIECKRSVTY
jgi:putative phage-type endonuclease